MILWVLFNGLLFVQGQNEGQRSSVALEGNVPADLVTLLEDDSDLEIVILEPSSGREALEEDRVHVVVHVQPAEGALEEDLEITVSYDSSREHSAFAQRFNIGARSIAVMAISLISLVAIFHPRQIEHRV